MPRPTMDVNGAEYQEILKQRELYRLYKSDYPDVKWAQEVMDRLEKERFYGDYTDKDYADFKKARVIVDRIMAKEGLGHEEHPTNHYIWRTRQDGKVRPEHAVNDGKIFAWDNPPPTGNPGDAFGCRCWGEPYDPKTGRGAPSSDGGFLTRVEVHSSQKITIHYLNGTSETRTGGSLAWRNNNPGNLRSGAFSTAHGAIGDNSGFAVFPNEESGYEASKALLRTGTYSKLTVSEAIARRSPSTENNTGVLQGEIIRDSGISGDRLMNNLSESELDDLLHSIHRFEG